MASRKLLLPSCTVYQLGRGREPMIDVGRTTLADALNTTASPAVLEPLPVAGERAGRKRPHGIAEPYWEGPGCVKNWPPSALPRQITRQGAPMACSSERKRGQSKAGPGSLLRPGAISLCPTRRCAERLG